jgi:hypothetical protein
LESLSMTLKLLRTCDIVDFNSSIANFWPENGKINCHRFGPKFDTNLNCRRKRGEERNFKIFKIVKSKIFLMFSIKLLGYLNNWNTVVSPSKWHNRWIEKHKYKQRLPFHYWMYRNCSLNFWLCHMGWPSTVVSPVFLITTCAICHIELHCLECYVVKRVSKSLPLFHFTLCLSVCVFT